MQGSHKGNNGRTQAYPGTETGTTPGTKPEQEPLTDGRKSGITPFFKRYFPQKPERGDPALR